MDITAEEGKELVDDRFDPKNIIYRLALAHLVCLRVIDDPYAYTYNLIQEVSLIIGLKIIITNLLGKKIKRISFLIFLVRFNNVA